MFYINKSLVSNLDDSAIDKPSFRGSMEYHPGFPGNAINSQPSEHALADHS